MNRRSFLQIIGLATAGLGPAVGKLVAAEDKGAKLDPGFAKAWLARWEKNILNDSRNRYCDREMGEEIGWLISPFLEGFYYGYRATGDIKWVERLVDWADSWIQRGTKEPDGFIGWPKLGTGGNVAEDLLTDSLLGEAIALRPIVLMSREVLEAPSLKAKFGSKASAYLNLAESIFEKWIARGCWREIDAGGVWVVPTFGIDRQTNKWTDGYERRNTEGFSNPDNKQNHIACWLIAMSDVTRKQIYKDHARKWWQVMKSRMRSREAGKFYVWNYWEPAGPWDYKPDRTLRHWVGVHPNGGYYAIDVHGIVTAFEHELVFTKEEIDRLIATNRDFMWNQQVAGAKFQRIDGGQPDPRWKNAPGVLWTVLVPYDETLRKIFLANHDPSTWGGLASTPWFLGKNHEMR